MPMVANMHPDDDHGRSGPARIRSVLAQRVEGHQDGDGDRRREDQLAGLLDAGMAPHAPVEPEDVVGHERDHQGDDEEGGEVLPVEAGGLVPEVDDLGHAVPGHDADGVEQR